MIALCATKLKLPPEISQIARLWEKQKNSDDPAIGCNLASLGFNRANLDQFVR